jgi:CRP-like cAMP-binding protein
MKKARMVPGEDELPTGEVAATAISCLADGDVVELSTEQVEAVRSMLSARNAPAGTLLFTAGSAPTDVYLLSRGVVELRRPLDPRRGLIATLRDRGVIGDVAGLLGRPHHVDAVAVTDVDLLAVPAADVPALLGAVPVLAGAWMADLAARVFETHHRIDELLAGHLDHRVGSALLRRADGHGKVDMTQEHLARLLGVQRSSINEATRRLEVRGLVKRGYGHLVVLDRARLEELLKH